MEIPAGGHVVTGKKLPNGYTVPVDGDKGSLVGADGKSGRGMKNPS